MTGAGKRRKTAQLGYGGRWQKARIGWLARHPLCVMCAAQGKVTAATVVDHIEPHRLGKALDSGDADQIAAARRRFWDRGNWQSLCGPHHDRDKQAAEQDRPKGSNLAGLPLDPGHHWNR